MTPRRRFLKRDGAHWSMWQYHYLCKYVSPHISQPLFSSCCSCLVTPPLCTPTPTGQSLRQSSLRQANNPPPAHIESRCVWITAPASCSGPRVEGAASVNKTQAWQCRVETQTSDSTWAVPLAAQMFPWRAVGPETCGKRRWRFLGWKAEQERQGESLGDLTMSWHSVLHQTSAVTLTTYLPLTTVSSDWTPHSATAPSCSRCLRSEVRCPCSPQPLVTCSVLSPPVWVLRQGPRCGAKAATTTFLETWQHRHPSTAPNAG